MFKCVLENGKKLRFYILIVFGHLLNVEIHFQWGQQLMDPMKLVHKTVQQLSIQQREIIEQKIFDLPGYFDFILTLKEFPSSMWYIKWLTLSFLIFSVLLSAYALIKLLDYEQWAYIFVWSIAVLSIPVGIIEQNWIEFVFGVYACYVLVEMRSDVLEGESVDDPK
ncbi:MAG: hypothetical protein KDD61_11745 [Bdellovibrionales bacterium]|nr:hypothetical protein [Bdellovibrionales bacterium]